jgi:hypothetical protein
MTLAVCYHEAHRQGAAGNKGFLEEFMKLLHWDAMESNKTQPGLSYNQWLILGSMEGHGGGFSHRNVQGSMRGEEQ